MRFIKSLSKDTIKMLERIYKHSKYHQVRQRAQAVEYIFNNFGEEYIINFA